MSLSLILVAMFEQPTPPNLSYHMPTPVHAISYQKLSLKYLSILFVNIFSRRCQRVPLFSRWVETPNFLSYRSGGQCVSIRLVQHILFCVTSWWRCRLLCPWVNPDPRAAGYTLTLIHTQRGLTTVCQTAAQHNTCHEYMCHIKCYRLLLFTIMEECSKSDCDLQMITLLLLLFSLHNSAT